MKYKEEFLKAVREQIKACVMPPHVPADIDICVRRIGYHLDNWLLVEAKEKAQVGLDLSVTDPVTLAALRFVDPTANFSLSDSDIQHIKSLMLKTLFELRKIVIRTAINTDGTTTPSIGSTETTTGDPSTKPPIGVEPQYIWNHNNQVARFYELQAAVDRYVKSGLTPSVEWIKEMDGLHNQLFQNKEASLPPASPKFTNIDGTTGRSEVTGGGSPSKIDQEAIKASESSGFSPEAFKYAKEEILNDVSHKFDNRFISKVLSYKPEFPPDSLVFYKEGNQTCCVYGNFINLHSSAAGFGNTKDSAERNLKKEAPDWMTANDTYLLRTALYFLRDTDTITSHPDHARDLREITSHIEDRVRWHDERSKAAEDKIEASKKKAGVIIDETGREAEDEDEYD